MIPFESNTFKYQTNLGVLAGCPPSEYAVYEGVAFRWVRDPCTVKDFVPQGFTNPKRWQDDTDLIKCKSWGLSMFETLDGAKARYLNLYNRKRVHQQSDFKRVYGTHIAGLILSAALGRAGDREDEFTHFTFHEHTGVELNNHITSISPIFEEDGTTKDHTGQLEA